LKNASRFRTSDIIEKGVLLLFFVLSHDIKRGVDGKETRAGITQIKKRRDEFLQSVRNIMEHSASNVEQV
jgi:hypothetical protein